MGAWSGEGQGIRALPLHPTGSLSAGNNEDPELGVARTSPVCKVLCAVCSGSFTHQNKGQGENVSRCIMTCPGGQQLAMEAL